MPVLFFSTATSSIASFGQMSPTGGQVVTLNEKHFRDLASVFDWRPYRQP